MQKNNYPPPPVQLVQFIQNQIPDPQAELRAYLNVSDAPLSQFASACAESHCAGNAAESSTELTEAKCKQK